MKKVLLISILATLLFAIPVLAADTGVKYPTANGVYSGSGFTNPNNAHATDNVYATVASTADGTYYTTFTGLYAAIPAGATIDGISVFSEGYTDGTIIINGDTIRLGAYVSNDGGSSYSTARNVFYAVDEPEAVKNHGGSTQLWEKTWTKESFTDANFRVAVKPGLISGGATQLNLDSVRVQVYYTAAAGGAVRQSEYWWD